MSVRSSLMTSDLATGFRCMAAIRAVIRWPSIPHARAFSGNIAIKLAQSDKATRRVLKSCVSIVYTSVESSSTARADIFRSLNLRQNWAAFSSHRATVFQEIRFTRAIADLFRPATLRVATSSMVARRCWSRWYGVPAGEQNVFSQVRHRYRRGASVINCCYAARGIGVSSTTTKTVDCPDPTFSDTHRNVASGKISLNVNRRVARPACIAGVLILAPNFNALWGLTKL